jgi:F plasmid transfer operon protein
MRIITLALSLLACASGVSPVLAQVPAADTAAVSTAPENPSDSLHENAKKGWFFYETQKKPPEDELPPVVPQVDTPPPPKEARCKSKDTWTADCGFVDPGKDFDFQSKERDALLHGMAMSRNDPKAVEAFQYYQKWVLDRSIEVANLWYYNTVQNPELSAEAKSPINTFGLRLMTEVKDSDQKSILTALKKEGAFYIYFSRHDCSFCASMTGVLTTVVEQTGLPMYNAALDDTCMPGFEDHCLAGPAVQAPAQALKVDIVPTLFLYVPQNTWIRIGTGVTDVPTLVSRTTSFFSAYRTALLKGVNNGQGIAPSVDFSSNGATGTATGVKSSGPARLPTADEVKALLQK